MPSKREGHRYLWDCVVCKRGLMGRFCDPPRRAAYCDDCEVRVRKNAERFRRLLEGDEGNSAARVALRVLSQAGLVAEVDEYVFLSHLDGLSSGEIAAEACVLPIRVPWLWKTLPERLERALCPKAKDYKRWSLPDWRAVYRGLEASALVTD